MDLAGRVGEQPKGSQSAPRGEPPHEDGEQEEPRSDALGPLDRSGHLAALARVVVEHDEGGRRAARAEHHGHRKVLEAAITQLDGSALLLLQRAPAQGGLLRQPRNRARRAVHRAVHHGDEDLALAGHAAGQEHLQHPPGVGELLRGARIHTGGELVELRGLLDEPLIDPPVHRGDEHALEDDDEAHQGQGHRGENGEQDPGADARVGTSHVSASR